MLNRQPLVLPCEKEKADSVLKILKTVRAYFTITQLILGMFVLI